MLWGRSRGQPEVIENGDEGGGVCDVGEAVPSFWTNEDDDVGK
jgi:hypothetical protein